MFQARIKKIMQTDEEIGKVAAAVPVLICILFRNVVYSLLCDYFSETADQRVHKYLATKYLFFTIALLLHKPV